MNWAEIWTHLVYFFNHSSLFIQSTLAFVFIVVIPVALFVACAAQINKDDQENS